MMKATARYDLGTCAIGKTIKAGSRVVEDDKRAATVAIPITANVSADFLDILPCGKAPFVPFLWGDNGAAKENLPIDSISLKCELEPQAIKLSKFSVGKTKDLVMEVKGSGLKVRARDQMMLEVEMVLHGEIGHEDSQLIVRMMETGNVSVELMAPAQGDLLADEQRQAAAAEEAEAKAKEKKGRRSFPGTADGTA